MAQITVYRVENKEGLGPYNSPSMELVKMLSQHSNVETHPAWMWDNIREKENLFAGFKSMEDLNSWFDGWIDTLLKLGFAIKEFLVDEDLVVYGRSGKQLAFIKQ